MNNNYQKYYSEDSLWQKIGKFAKLAGTKVVYAALLLYFVLKDKNVPLKTKVIITAALGYFIFSADAIPDLAPLVGFTDDFGVLMFALSQISGNLTPEIKQKAKVKLSSWFGEIDDDEISEVNNSDH